ncbi:cuticle collagen 13-like [Psammomys obesus]|uniref:cuticle collagen 13-like n=1 Tax=Psammomys obesus TaxID=48139 RepID=UPI002452A7ED|nr:cuticle collagen 13-like [Psammomys obesus]
MELKSPDSPGTMGAHWSAMKLGTPRAGSLARLPGSWAGYPCPCFLLKSRRVGFRGFPVLALPLGVRGAGRHPGDLGDAAWDGARQLIHQRARQVKRYNYDFANWLPSAGDALTGLRGAAPGSSGSARRFVCTARQRHAVPSQPRLGPHCNLTVSRVPAPGSSAGAAGWVTEGEAGPGGEAEGGSDRPNAAGPGTPGREFQNPVPPGAPLKGVYTAGSGRRSGRGAQIYCPRPKWCF